MISRRLGLAGAVLIGLIALLLCLLPKPENDLFFELRIGSDILRTHHLPRVDTYSWTERGRPWDVPEWLAFVLYALAFRGGGFPATWLLMAALILGATGVVWFGLRRFLGAGGAFLLCFLMLLALSGGLQQRPYAFTYLLLPVSLLLLTQARAGRPRLLLWLPPLCALWTNLHQGVVVLIGLLFVCAAGDALEALWLFSREARAAPPDLLSEKGIEEENQRDLRRAARRQRLASAGRMLAAAAACFGAGMVSPYGWHVYWNILITLRDPALMSGVTEWNSVLILPAVQLQPLIALALIVFGGLLGSRRRSLADTLAAGALLAEALLHARNIPLFALGGPLLCAAHLPSALRRVRDELGLAPRAAPHPRLTLAFALACTGAATLLAFVHLRPAIGPNGWSPQGLGEAVARVPRYPAGACAFMDQEGFPSHLRLLNDFEIGGFLMWRLPREPVFVDGRLDVYTGQTFENMLVLARAPGTPAWADLVRRYDFDCVLTRSPRQARAFQADPSWQLVYRTPARSLEQPCTILLRRRPPLAALIARCLKAQNAVKTSSEKH